MAWRRSEASLNFVVATVWLRWESAIAARKITPPMAIIDSTISSNMTPDWEFRIANLRCFIWVGVEVLSNDVSSLYDRREYEAIVERTRNLKRELLITSKLSSFQLSEVTAPGGSLILRGKRALKLDPRLRGDRWNLRFIHYV